MILTLVALLVACAGSEVWAQSCHSLCTCGRSNMKCGNAGLTRTPEGYWPIIIRLELNANNITELHDYSFSGFPALNEIILNDNQLTSLDFSVFSLLPLINLAVNNNHITKVIVPDDVEFPYLQELAMENNKITELEPDIFTRLAPELTYLSLRNNPLKVLPGDPVINHPTLNYIVLDGIDASDITGGAFPELPKLSIFHFKLAGIRNITGVFVNLRLLRYLFLDGNNITEVTAGSFAPVLLTKFFYLYENPLQKFDVSAAKETFSASSTLDISNSPMACDCLYEELFTWGSGNRVGVYALCQGTNVCQFS